ncbi:MAG: hypothetical protein IKD08_05835 [Alphaproteobacteria bacterium]|nr:hypothetical protein [Alphaproteobacteria bacterium]
MLAGQRKNIIAQCGRSAIEMLGVLGVIGVISAGVTQLAGMATRQTSSAKAIVEIQDMADKIRALYSWKTNYRSPADILGYLKDQGVLRVDTNGAAVPPVGTSISVTGQRLTSAGATCGASTAGCHEVFTITFTSVPKENCLDMTAYNWGNYIFKVNGVLASAKDASGYPLLPMSKTQALAYCTAVTQDVSLSFY